MKLNIKCDHHLKEAHIDITCTKFLVGDMLTNSISLSQDTSKELYNLKQENLKKLSVKSSKKVIYKDQQTLKCIQLYFT